MRETLYLIEFAWENNKKALSEYENKQVISAYGIPVAEEAMVEDLCGVPLAARDLTYHVVLKACSAEITP